jgi:hypothetical protein
MRSDEFNLNKYGESPVRRFYLLSAMFAFPSADSAA